MPRHSAGMKVKSQLYADSAAKYPCAEVSARNIPVSSDELRSKLKVRPSADLHIFGVTIDLPEGQVRKLIAAKRDF